MPFEVTRLLRVFRPGIYDAESGWSDDLMARAVDDLEAIWHGGARAPALGRYILFLKAMSHRFRLVRSRFPRFNAKSTHGAKDWDGMMTSPAEMLAIANQLFVLKSNGLDGHFLEFGCFKGFSSSCLSFCCAIWISRWRSSTHSRGCRPRTAATTSPGEFCGTFEEVSSNIDEFGEPRVVSFHKGFFADTLPHFRKRPIIAIWMDVDLFSSAMDVAQVFDGCPDPRWSSPTNSPRTDAERTPAPEKSEVFPRSSIASNRWDGRPSAGISTGCSGPSGTPRRGFPSSPRAS